MVDLHLHSTASDGTYSPEELVKLAAKLELKAIAITDHDSIDAIEIAIKEGNRLNVDVIPAIEFSSDLDGRDIHILGYYIDYRHPWFDKHLEKLQSARYKRTIEMIEYLREAGLDILLKDVLKVAGNGATVGRAHLARAMLEKGCIDNIQEAFDKYIGASGPCYVRNTTYSPQEVIKIIRQVGGVSVLAHPGVSKVDEFIADFIDVGLQGLEAYHSKHSQAQTLKYKNMAKKLDLIVTGGSDCHGLSRGLLMGSANVPDSVLDDLKALKNSTN